MRGLHWKGCKQLLTTKLFHGLRWWHVVSPSPLVKRPSTSACTFNSPSCSQTRELFCVTDNDREIMPLTMLGTLPHGVCCWGQSKTRHATNATCPIEIDSFPCFPDRCLHHIRIYVRGTWKTLEFLQRKSFACGSSRVASCRLSPNSSAGGL